MLDLDTVSTELVLMRVPSEAQIEARRRVQWLHREAGIPIAELARRMNMKAPVVSRWINEHHYPSPMAVRLIAEAYRDELVRRASSGQIAP